MNRLLLALTLITAFATHSRAATITVNDASPGSVAGRCTLQDAVAAANTDAVVSNCTAGNGADIIVFASGITSISLTSGMSSPMNSGQYGLAVTDDLTIDGSGNGNVAIQRSTAPGTPGFGIIGGAGAVFSSITKTLTLKSLTISNAAAPGGAAVYAYYLDVSDSTIDGNAVRGLQGTNLTITNSTISNNQAATAAGISCTTLQMTGSTVSGNAATSDGGGIYCNDVTVTNSTVSGNIATFSGGGILAGSLVADFVTVADNVSSQGAGVYIDASMNSRPQWSLSHTVVARNSMSGAPGTFLNEFYTTWNIAIHGDHSWIGTMNTVASNDLAAGVRIASCPSLGLAALADNGGGRRTQALLAGSCLLDAGAACSATALPYDERGSGYSRCVNGTLDIGAFESAGTPASPPTATTNAATGIGQSTATLNGTVSANGASTTVTFGYGLTNTYGATVTATQSPLASSASGASVSAVADVYCGLTYHFHVIANNGTGGDIDGGDRPFTSSACPAATYPIAANANPAAGGTAGCTPNPVSSGGSSTCTAMANAGYAFTGWSGACSGANCTLSNVTAAASVTANFSLVSPPAPAGVTAVPLLSPWSLALLSLLTLLVTLAATTVSRRD